jgi:2-polyprenyl-3-methyl-5-hydroxy-6-metoxy-1,4-benzoquinol methylase
VNGNKTDKSYWDYVWETTPLPHSIRPYTRDIKWHAIWKFHEYFRSIFSTTATQGKRFLEIGCARSVWLPYFAKEFGFKVYGIDYSEIGCQQAMQILSNEGVKGEIVCADFFSPLESMLKAFDVVVSFGVLEHFKDTTACIAAFSKFLKPGGLLITNIPNLCGLNGIIQKMINRSIFDIHVPLDKKSLVRVHQINGLRIISCDYFLFVNLGVLNIENLKGSLFYTGAARLRSLINKVTWICERAIPIMLKPNRWSSPYINCVAVKE